VVTKLDLAPEFSANIYIGELDKTVIFLAGKAGSGKGTAGGFIKKYVERITPLTVEAIPMATVLKEIAKTLGWNGVKTETSRKFLQVLGTDATRRVIGEDIWINQWFKLARKSRADIIVIDDTRFCNEIDRIRDYCLDNLALKFEGAEDGYTDYNHESERPIPDEYFHATIKNLGTIAEFHDSLEAEILILLHTQEGDFDV